MGFGESLQPIVKHSLIEAFENAKFGCFDVGYIDNKEVIILRDRMLNMKEQNIRKIWLKLHGLITIC